MVEHVQGKCHRASQEVENTAGSNSGLPNEASPENWLSWASPQNLRTSHRVYLLAPDLGFSSALLVSLTFMTMVIKHLNESLVHYIQMLTFPQMLMGNNAFQYHKLRSMCTWRRTYTCSENFRWILFGVFVFRHFSRKFCICEKLGSLMMF